MIPGFTAGSKLGASWLRLKTMLTRAPDLDAWESERGYPLLEEPLPAHDSEEWRISAEPKRLVLLDPGSEPPPRAN